MGINLLMTTKQVDKASPVYPSLQLQIGEWYLTIQTVFSPQDWHGSIHLLFLQALFRLHSELDTHSGLQ